LLGELISQHLVNSHLNFALENSPALQKHTLEPIATLVDSYRNSWQIATISKVACKHLNSVNTKEVMMHVDYFLDVLGWPIRVWDSPFKSVMHESSIIFWF